MKLKNKLMLTVAATALIGLACPSVINADNLDSKIENSEKKINDLSSQKASTDKTLAQIDSDISNLNTEINQVLVEKTKLEKEVNQLSVEIKELEKNIEKRNTQIEEQARSAQVNNDQQDLVNVLLDSESVSDAIGRTLAYTKLVSANKDIMETQKSDKKALAEKKQDIENKVKEISEKAATLQQKQEELEVVQAEQVQLASQILASLDQEKNNKDKYVKEKAVKKAAEEKAAAEKIARANEKRMKEIAAQEAAAQKELKVQKERQQKAAEEKQLSAEGPVSISKPSSEVGSSDNSKSEVTVVEEESVASDESNDNGGSTTIVANDSGFINPLSGGYTITSGFGPRTDPTGYSGGFHDGIDLATSAGTPIMASMAGTVVESSYHPSAGNHVIIQHSNGLYTYYMHMNAPGIGAGAQVSAGQVIGAVGTTGNSTGNHLHFGISSSLWGGFIDPTSMLSF